MPLSPAAGLCLRAALRGDAVVARPHRGAGLAALILALLARLFARTETAWTLSLDDDADLDDAPHGIRMPAIGRAPHAAYIEAGLVPDWILPGMRNRGMRPAAAPGRQRTRARPARAPPISDPPPF